MKRIVSVSLGSSKRDKKSVVEILGETFELERRGTDGDMRRFKSTFEELDGKVDAMGIGGADLYVVSGERRWAFREIAQCIAGVKLTPVVDGSGLKHTLERAAIEELSSEIDWKQERAMLMSAVDRYGMAQAIAERCSDVIFGDLMFGLGLPLPVRSYKAVERLANILLPVITKLPFKWFYPTGEKQDERKPTHGKFFADRTFLCGDSLYLLRYAPDRMEGKTILTQSVRTQNLDFFRSAGVRRVYTTTPVIGGETFATNVMEAALVALIGPHPEKYRETLNQIGWKPNRIDLN